MVRILYVPVYTNSAQCDLQKKKEMECECIHFMVAVSARKCVAGCVRKSRKNGMNPLKILRALCMESIAELTAYFHIVRMHMFVYTTQ